MTKQSSQEDEAMSALDSLLREAARDAPVPSAALLARVSSDAQSVQESFASVPLRVETRSGWRQWLAEIGGFPGLGGLAACACFGVYLGLAGPQLPTSLQVFEGLGESFATDMETGDVFSTLMLSDLDWIDEG